MLLTKDRLVWLTFPIVDIDLEAESVWLKKEPYLDDAQLLHEQTDVCSSLVSQLFVGSSTAFQSRAGHRLFSFDTCEHDRKAYARVFVMSSKA